MMRFAFLTAVAVGLLPLRLNAQDVSQLQRENVELRSRLDRLETLVERLEPNAGTSERTFSAVPASGTLNEAAPVEHASFASWNLNSALSGDAPAFPTVKLTGFFQLDTGWAHQDAANRAAVGDVQDGIDFRRARLAATGNVAENVAYMLEMDFAFPGRPSFMDVWGEVRDVDFLQNVRFGQYRQPFGLDGLTSVKELTFIERALPFAFLPFRQTGVMAHGASKSEDMTWWLSGFRAPVDAFGGNVGDNAGYGMAARATAVVIDDGDAIVHLGGAYSLIYPTTDMARYRSTPEFFDTDALLGSTPAFVDTGVIAADHVNLFAGELAATSGAWHAQGELLYAVVDRLAGSSVAFSGVTFQSGWILTGEHRPYDRKNAVLGRVVPCENFGLNGGCGAWEVAARWSYLDLNDAGVNGGQLNNVTAGLNWYLNRYTKLQLNYIHAFLKTPGLGDSDADIVAMRAQIDF